MNETIQSNFQIQLIALGLLFIIPITVNLGIDFFYPAITWQDFEKAKEDFLKEKIPNFNPDMYEKYKYAYPDEHQLSWDMYKEETKKWNDSQEHQALKTKQNQQKKVQYLALLVYVILLTISLQFIKIPILKCPIIGTILYILLFEIQLKRPYYDSVGTEKYFLGIPLQILELITIFICLVLIIKHAYQDQNL